MARDYSLNTVVPHPGTPIGYLEFQGNRLEVFVTEEWRRQWFENVGTALFGPTGEDDVTLSIPSGSYVAAVTVTANKGIIVTGTPAPGYTPNLDLSQDIRTSATVTFQNVNCPGNVDGRDVSVDGVKLDGIQTGATANSTDAFLLARANHTGTQGWGTITSTPTTIAGYGITNAYTKSEVDTAIGGKVTKDASITAASEAHAVTDFATTNAALNALGAIINEIRTAMNA